MNKFKLFTASTILLLAASISYAATCNQKQQQEINQFLTIQIDKSEIANVQPFIEYMRGFDTKIYQVNFDPETVQITIYYTPYIKLGDVVELVGLYFQNFKKIGGTEL